MGLDDRYATDGETREAIEGLHDADYVKLMLIARYFHKTRRHGSRSTPDDLLNTAFVKTLAGKRRWNKTVSIIKHLDRVMESESGHLLEKSDSQDLLPLDAAAGHPDTGTRPPDDRLCTSDELQQVLRLFEGDTVALDVLRLKAEGLLASEIELRLKLTETQYDTVTKRIRRVIIRYLNEGGNSL